MAEPGRGVADASLLVSSQLKLKRIKLEVSVASELPRVMARPGELVQVLLNLLVNAMHATPENGVIRITAEKATDDCVDIAVADSGPGIPPADRDRMFVPYFSTKPRGTGLALAIVHKVVTDHRGTIRVEDAEPHGARFVIDLPA